MKKTRRVMTLLTLVSLVIWLTDERKKIVFATIFICALITIVTAVLELRNKEIEK